MSLILRALSPHAGHCNALGALRAKARSPLDLILDFGITTSSSLVITHISG